MSTIDDDGKAHRITLDEALEAVLKAFEVAGANPPEPSTPDGAWATHAAEYGKDRGERVIYLELADPDGQVESFMLSLTRDVLDG